ncbi:MAG: hypothetical protein ACI4IF_07825 [Acutalibacteraceae bacterium]
MLIKRYITKNLKNILFKTKEVKWFAFAFAAIIFIVFPLLKKHFEINYGINNETLNMIICFILTFYPFLNAVLVTVVSRGMFEETGNELFYFYKKLSSQIISSFALTVPVYLSSFLILINNYGFLYTEYIKTVLLSVFLSGVSILLLVLTKTAVPSLLALVSLLAYTYFNRDIIFDIAGSVRDFPPVELHILCVIGILALAFSVLFYKKIPAYK